MPAAVLVVPGRLDERTGGYIYNRRIVEGLRSRGWQIDVIQLDDSFPHPTDAALAQAAAALAGLGPGTVVIIDSLAIGAMPELVIREAPRLCVIALMHLPLSAAIDLDAETARRFEASERRALESVALTIVTGRAAVPMLIRLGVPTDRIAIVEPGTTPPGALPHPRTPVPSHLRPPAPSHLELLCVATINYGKAHEVLLRALATVTFKWHLTCAGSLTRSPLTVTALERLAAELDLGDRVSLAGDLAAAELDTCYRRADVFVLATLQETYGMAVAEALSYGLPVVASAVGAIPDLLADEAGIAVPPGNVAALATALERVGTDPSLRAQLARGAQRRAAALPTWQDAATRMAAAIEAATPHG